jgi:hypothetical protein
VKFFQKLKKIMMPDEPQEPIYLDDLAKRCEREREKNPTIDRRTLTDQEEEYLFPN